MNPSAFSQIVDTFNALSVSEQLWLIERLVHQTRRNSEPQVPDSTNQLALMAADPEVQRELQNIEAEFAFAEFDGLENS